MIKKTIFGLLAFSTLTMFVSCSTNNTYNSFQKVKNYKWSNKDTLFYTPKIDDIDKSYDIYLSVRYQKEYDFSNLWLQVYGLEKLQFDRIEIPLFKNDGTPYGKGLKSNFTVNAAYLKGYKFKKSGTQKIAIIQNMRKNPLPGVMDIGIIIKPSLK